GAVDVHVAHADVVQAVAVVVGPGHLLAGDLGGAVEGLVVEGVLLGHRQLQGVAVDGGRAGVDQPLDVVLAAGFQDVEGAADVDVEGGFGEVVALQQPEGGEVDDG